MICDSTHSVVFDARNSTNDGWFSSTTHTTNHRLVVFRCMKYVEKITSNVWKIKADSNMYVLLDEKTIIDTGNRSSRNILETFMSNVILFDKVEKVIFTHLHYDHIGNFDLFKKAKFYASEEAINSLKENKLNTILNKDIAERFNIELNKLESSENFKIIKTPGHTKGSVCILYKDVLFSGDTIFSKGAVGRVDLPTSVPDKFKESLNKLSNLKFKILAPGHDY